MEETLSKDPIFRSQYECGVKEDPQFEAALSGSPQPRISIPAVTKPLAQMQWLQPLGPR